MAPPGCVEQCVFQARSVCTADYGPGGRAHLQEVLEGLVGFLPPGCVTALIGYDGQIKPDPDKLLLPGAAYDDRDRFLEVMARLGKRPVHLGGQRR